MKKYKELKIVMVGMLILCLLLTACHEQRTDNNDSNISSNSEAVAENNKVDEDSEEIDEPKKLRINLNFNGFFREDGRYKEEFVHVGDILLTEKVRYLELIETFAEEKRVQVEINYDTYPINMANNQFDVVISETKYSSEEWALSNFNSQYCYDLTTFFDEDGLYTDEEKYVTSALKAGVIGDQQLIFPLAFNLSMLFTSEQSLERQGLNISTESTFDELVTEFVAAYRDTSENALLYQKNYETMGSSLYGRSSASPIQTFTLPSGKEFTADDLEFYAQIQGLYESFVVSDLNMPLINIQEGQAGEDYQEKSLLTGIQSIMGSNQADAFDIAYENIGCFTSTSSQGLWIPAAMQAVYYESRYQGMDEDFVCIAIPEKEKTDAYSATITTYGVVTAKSKEPELAYELLKYLADHDNTATHDLSINRTCIEEVLTQLMSTSLTLNDRNYPEKQYIMNPMSEETGEYLMNVIDRIDRAYLIDVKAESDAWVAMDQRILGGNKQ